MDKYTNEAIQNITKKLDWAKWSSDKLLKNKTKPDERHFYFWGFLSSFNQSSNYFSRLVDQLNKSINSEHKCKKCKKYPLNAKDAINYWAKNVLNDDEKKCCRLLLDIRIQNTHDVPVYTDYKLSFESFSDFDKEEFSINGGHIIGEDNEEITVEYKEEIYKFDYLVKHGLASINKLIIYLPKVKDFLS